VSILRWTVRVISRSEGGGVDKAPGDAHTLTGIGVGWLSDEEFSTRFGLKQSGGIGDPYRELHELGEAAGWAGSGGVLLLHFKATDGGLLRPHSIQGEGLGSFRGLGQCSLLGVSYL
jgi:hypothetical protein